MTYSLLRWQRRQFRHIVDLYEPVAVSVDGSKKLVPRSYPDTPTFAGVLCAYIATEDFQEQGMSGLLGQMTENNIMTQDKFLFHSAQAISTNWQVVMKTLLDDGSHHPYYGYRWEIQGEGKVQAGAGRQMERFNFRLMYGKLGVADKA